LLRTANLQKKPLMKRFATEIVYNNHSVLSLNN